MKDCPSIWFRHVDGTFTMFDSKTGAERFPHYLNNRHANIKLTMVVVENQEIPFLNVLVKRNQKNIFSTTVYRKKSFTGLFTKWDSFTPRKYKFHLIRALTNRCLRICSTSSLLQSTLKLKSYYSKTVTRKELFITT